MSQPISFTRNGLHMELRTKFYVAPMSQYADQATTPEDLKSAGYVPASLPSASEQWAPVLDDESMIACEEGQTYLFAIAMRDGHWEWFVNRLVWDSETEPTWGDDDPGWGPQEGMFFRELPAPPASKPVGADEGKP